MLPNRENYGAEDEIRTRDIRLGKATYYHCTTPAYGSLGFIGGSNRARTCDPLLVRQVLSQLSYAPMPPNPRMYLCAAQRRYIILIQLKETVKGYF